MITQSFRAPRCWDTPTTSITAPFPRLARLWLHVVLMDLSNFGTLKQGRLDQIRLLFIVRRCLVIGTYLHTYNICYCTFSPFGTTLATCSTNGFVKLWDTKSGRLWLLPTLSVCVCVSVCPAFTASISVTMGWILIKLGGNVGNLVRLIVLKFEHSAAKGNTTHKG